MSASNFSFESLGDLVTRVEGSMARREPIPQDALLQLKAKLESRAQEKQVSEIVDDICRSIRSHLSTSTQRIRDLANNAFKVMEDQKLGTQLNEQTHRAEVLNRDWSLLPLAQSTLRDLSEGNEILLTTMGGLGQVTMLANAKASLDVIEELRVRLREYEKERIKTRRSIFIWRYLLGVLLLGITGALLPEYLNNNPMLEPLHLGVILAVVAAVAFGTTQEFLINPRIVRPLEDRMTQRDVRTLPEFLTLWNSVSAQTRTVEVELERKARELVDRGASVRSSVSDIRGNQPKG
jgi:hypothetical protein